MRLRRILILVAIVLLIGVGVWYFYIRPKQQVGVSPVPNVLKAFFPSTTSDTTGSFNTDTTLPTGNNTGAAANTGPLKQLTSRPVAGFSVFTVATTLSIPATDPKAKPTLETLVNHYVRYVSRNNGYVYEIKNGAIPLQISNIFIPNVYEAFFADANNTAILRFLRPDNQTIATYSVPVPPLNTDGTRTQKSGIYLPDNISSLAVSGDQKQLLRITEDQNGGVVSTSNSIGGSTKVLLHSAFKGWLPQWNTASLFLQTKAASAADGFLYKIDPSTQRLAKVVGNVAGLTTSVSPNGTYVLYSQSIVGGFVTKLFNTVTQNTVTLSPAILPEKCAWLQNQDLICAGNAVAAAGTYPDDWYQGTMHFSDQLYYISSTGGSRVLYDGQDTSFDMTSVQVDEGQKLVYFIDKNTGLLWELSY